MGLEESKIGDYQVNGNKVLGKGAFGAVYEAKHVKKGHLAAVKQCQIKTEMHGSLAMKEIKAMQKIPPHKHIVKMLDFEYYRKAFWIVMEFCDRGDLEKYMKKYSPNLERQLKIMYQCACAVSHMHNYDPDEPIVHRDLKPQNILFKNENGKEVVKIADFGLTKVAEAGGDDGSGGAQMKSQVGTPPFMAPELFAGAKYGESVDTFALGLVFLAMINFKPSDDHLIPLTAHGEEKLSEGTFVAIGQEMLQAKLSGEKQPNVARKSPLDGAKMKGIKALITEMTVFDKDKRKPMKDVVESLQKIAAGSSPSSMVTDSVIKGLTLSNLSLAKTKVAPSLGGSTAYDQPSKKVSHDIPSTVKEEDSSSKDDDDDDGSTPDLGYLLMRQMLEDGLRKKRQEEEAAKAKKASLEAAARLLPLMALMRLLDSDSEDTALAVGDRVRIEKDMQKVKDLQIDHGGWAKGMDKYLDEEGIVKEIKDDIISVKFPNGQSLRFNIKLCTKVGSGDGGMEERKDATKSKLIKGKFQILDVVKFGVNEEKATKLQSGHGGWNKRMRNVLDLRGVVHRVFDDSDVMVEFMNGEKWCLNPDILEKVDTSREEIEAGDVVIISDDKETVKKNQKGHGEWNDKMAQTLGRSGIVRRVGKLADSGNTVGVVEVGDSKWTYNIRSLKLIAKGEDMVLMMLKKQMAED